MQAIKAVYDNGIVKFDTKPRYKGIFQVLIIFPNGEGMEKEAEPNLYFQGTKEMDKVLDAELHWKPNQFIQR
jgi:hypothetical protein